MRERLRELRDFSSGRVLAKLGAGAAIGALLSAAEIGMAFALQAFLASLGVTTLEAVRLPEWIRVDSLWFVLGLLVAVGFTRSFLQWLQCTAQARVLNDFLLLQKTRIMRWAFHSQSVSSGEAMTLFHQHSVSSGLMLFNIQGLIIQLSSAVVILVSLFFITFKATLIVLVLSALLMLSTRVLDRKLKSAAEELSRDSKAINERILTSIRNLLLIRIYGTQHEEEEQANQAIRKFTRLTVFSSEMAGLKFVLPQVLGVILLCVIAVFWKLNRPGTGAELVSYIYLFVRFTQSFSSVVQTYTAILSYWPQWRDYHGWWKTHRDGALAPRERPPLVPESDLIAEPVGWRLSGLGFRYPGAATSVLSDLSIEVDPGQALIITGPSGVGKSTLLALMLGNLEPTAGSVSVVVGGQTKPLSQARDRILPRLGYVGPESFLLDGTIRENLIYGLRSTPTTADLDEAIRLSECQFVYDFKDQLDHRLTEQGQGLSAGQKQRLALARALLRKPRVLVLDEATANLDADTESRLVDTLSHFKGKLTLIAVTHREGLLRIADRRVRL